MVEMKIEYLPVDGLRPYERNAKKHPDEQVEHIANSIREFGFKQPLVIDKDNVLVIGHGRLLAAKRLGVTEVPCIRADDLTDEQIKALRLADNKTNESDWDTGLLDVELDDITDIDMGLFGFDIKEEQVKEDEYEPTISENPKAKKGEIYALGRHRLMCGDSTSAEDVALLVNGEKVDMLLTDPPYGVDYQGQTGNTRRKIANDALDDSAFREFLRSMFSAARSVLKDGAAFHVWYGEARAYVFRGGLADAGLQCRQQLVWVKNNATLSRQDFQHQYECVLTGLYAADENEENGFEMCMYGWNKGAHKWKKKRREKDVLFFDKPLASKLHPTMKPVLLFDYEMKCNTDVGDIVLDLFGGSGTTLIAAEQNGRTAYIMELDTAYVDVIIDRWERFTGEKAVLLNG